MSEQELAAKKNKLSDQIKWLMENRPDELDALKYGEITFTVRNGQLKTMKVLHTHDVEKMQEENTNGDAKDQ
jgi:hypothetical protein